VAAILDCWSLKVPIGPNPSRTCAHLRVCPNSPETEDSCEGSVKGGAGFVVQQVEL
jgi:hypothetical protein